MTFYQAQPPGLGRRERRAHRRPRGDLAARHAAERRGRSPAPSYFSGRPGPARRRRRVRPARPFATGLGRPPGLPAAARSRACCSWPTCSRRSTGSASSCGSTLLLAGKDAHPQTYLVGGMALAPPWGGPAASRTRQHPQVPDHNAPDRAQRRGHRPDATACVDRGPRVRRPGPRAGHAAPAGRGLPGVGLDRRGARQLPGVRGVPAGRRRGRRAAVPAARSAARTATSSAPSR